MSALTNSASYSEPTIIPMDSSTLPPVKLHQWNTASAQIAGYFRQLIDIYCGNNEAVRIQLPSVLTLCGFFNCCEMDIFDALFELKEQAYQYQLHGIDGPIKLWDPYLRKATPFVNRPYSNPLNELRKRLFSFYED